MEPNSSEMSDYDDEIIDTLNEYPTIFNYVTDCGLETENKLKFDGDAELAKKYEENEAASALLDLYNANESNLSTNGYSDAEAKKIETSGSSDGALDGEDFLLKMSLLDSVRKPSYNLPTTFQRPHEPRIKYLVRSLKLWQEFSNSGDLDRLQVLFNDIMTKDCLLINSSAFPPVLGRDKIFEQRVSFSQYIPDFCFFFNNIDRPKKRVITFNGNSFGTLPYPNVNDKSTASWNIFEFAPAKKLDEEHEIQKQKYDLLKSQNKTIKFERRASWFVLLSRDVKYIKKIMAANTKMEIF